MASLRNNDLVATDPAPEGPETTRRDAYLDAARDCILDVGWRRTTLTEVARRAGVSRMTMYRAWPDMSALIGDLMTREWVAIAAPVAPATSLDDFATSAVNLVRAMRSNDLLARILELDPDVLLPYLLDRPGRSQSMLLDLIGANLLAGQAAGWARQGEVRTLARGLVLAAHGFALSAQTMTDEHTTLAQLDDVLHALVRGLLSS